MPEKVLISNLPTIIGIGKNQENLNGNLDDLPNGLNRTLGSGSSFFPAVPEGESPGWDSDKVSAYNYLI